MENEGEGDTRRAGAASRYEKAEDDRAQGAVQGEIPGRRRALAGEKWFISEVRGTRP